MSLLPARFSGAVLMVVLLVVGAGCGRFSDPEPNAWPDTDLGANEVITYAETPSRPLHLHVFTPASSHSLTPAVIFFHGGALVRTPLDQFAPQAAYLANRGMVGIVAEYRVRADGGTPDSSRTDARAALDYVRSNAADLGIDPSRVAVSGGSAGGALAANLANNDNASSRPDALILFNPAIGPSDSPQADLPIQVFHGDADRTVAVSNAIGYCEGALDCRIDIWPGGDHGFFNAVNAEAHAHTTAMMDAFLVELGWLPA